MYYPCLGGQSKIDFKKKVDLTSHYPLTTTAVRVTIAQLTLRGILVKPLALPSMTYIGEPKMTTKVITVMTKTVKALNRQIAPELKFYQ